MSHEIGVESARAFCYTFCYARRDRREREHMEAKDDKSTPPETAPPEWEDAPLDEVLGGCAAGVMYVSAASLLLVALYVLAATPQYVSAFAGLQRQLPFLTRFFLDPWARVGLVVAGVVVFAAFARGWNRGKLRFVAILAPSAFVLALVTACLWHYAMHPDFGAGGVGP